jgi:hypothetical protein
MQYNAGNLDVKRAIIEHVLHNEHVIIHGVPGTGKSSFVRNLKFPAHLISYFEKYDGIDFTSTAFSSIFQLSSVFYKKRLIVLDNFDTIDIKKQRHVITCIKSSVYPVVIVTSDLSKIASSLKDLAYIHLFNMLTRSELERLIHYWKVNGIVKIEKDVFGTFDGNVRKLLNNYDDYENASKPRFEESSAKSLALLVFNHDNFMVAHGTLMANKYKLKTVLEYVNASLFSFYGSAKKIMVASDTLSFINTILFESSNLDYIAGLLLTIPERDYPGTIKYIKINTRKDEEVEEEIDE